jgi:CCR4-NOT transcriptional regulation complex NOT5 subunit
MGRGSLAGALIACLVLATTATGCQKLYGGSPERLKNPERKKKPDDPDIAATPVKYVEDCTANFRDDPKLVRVNTGLANQLVGDGDTAMQNANKAKDAASQAELIKVSIDKYRNALIKDPYNHEATLKLALAYDMVYRKGCALAMLKRIQSLQANPKYAKQANLKADEVVDNASWFKGYRKDAVAAVGR